MFATEKIAVFSVAQYKFSAAPGTNAAVEIILHFYDVLDVLPWRDIFFVSHKGGKNIFHLLCWQNIFAAFKRAFKHFKRNDVVRLNKTRVVLYEDDDGMYRHIADNFFDFNYVRRVLFNGVVQFVFYFAVRQNLCPFRLFFWAVNSSWIVFGFNNENAVAVDSHMIYLRRLAVGSKDEIVYDVLPVLDCVADDRAYEFFAAFTFV